MLFFYYVRFVGRLFVKGSGKPVEILAKLNEMVGFSADEEIELYEVSCIKFSFLPAYCSQFIIWFQQLPYPSSLIFRK